MRRGLALPLIAAAVVTAFAAPCLRAAEQPAPAAPVAPEKKDDPVKVPVAIAPALTESEANLKSFVEGAFPKEGAPGGRTSLTNRKPASVTVQQAALAGLLRNLEMARAEKQEDVIKAAREEARAVFDPVLTAAVEKDYSQTMTRHRIGRVFHKATQLINGENRLVFSPDAVEATQIQYLIFANPRPNFFTHERVDASVRSPQDPQGAHTFSAEIDQQLPWGPSVSISAVSVRRQSFDELGGEFGAPWTTSLSVSMDLPLPGTKDFGRYALADVNLKVAGYDKERAFWDTKTIINSTMVDIDHAYWDLAGAVENLRAAVDNRKSLEKILSNVEQMVQAGRTTDYGRQQVVAELANVKESEEAAWEGFLKASNRLNNLLDQDKSLVFFPLGYGKLLYENIPLNSKDANEIALDNRPELKAEKISQKSSDLLVQFNRHQLKRPDIRFKGEYNHKQLGIVFGYQDWWDTIRNLQHQDARVENYSLVYTRAIQQRTLRGQYDGAKAEASKQSVVVEQTVNTIEEDVGNALVLLMARKKQLELADDNLKLAQESLKQAREFFDAGRLTEFEMVTKNRDVLFADFAHVAAAVEYKKAETQLLFAEGILPYLYANMTAPNSLEKRRIGVLDSANALRFFGPSGAKTDGGGNKAQEAPAPKK
ncbi:MAG: TolC family protein [Planctomycetes bacterium]|nr:TolC family protein [Planctomycetota bacterium]